MKATQKVESIKPIMANLDDLVDDVLILIASDYFRIEELLALRLTSRRMYNFFRINMRYVAPSIARNTFSEIPYGIPGYLPAVVSQRANSQEVEQEINHNGQNPYETKHQGQRPNARPSLPSVTTFRGLQLLVYRQLAAIVVHNITLTPTENEFPGATENLIVRLIDGFRILHDLSYVSQRIHALRDSQIPKPPQNIDRILSHHTTPSFFWNNGFTILFRKEYHILQLRTEYARRMTLEESVSLGLTLHLLWSIIKTQQPRPGGDGDRPTHYNIFSFSGQARWGYKSWLNWYFLHQGPGCLWRAWCTPSGLSKLDLGMSRLRSHISASWNKRSKQERQLERGLAREAIFRLSIWANLPPFPPNSDEMHRSKQKSDLETWRALFPSPYGIPKNNGFGMTPRDYISAGGNVTLSACVPGHKLLSRLRVVFRASGWQQRKGLLLNNIDSEVFDGQDYGANEKCVPLEDKVVVQWDPAKSDVSDTDYKLVMDPAKRIVVNTLVHLGPLDFGWIQEMYTTNQLRDPPDY